MICQMCKAGRLREYCALCRATGVQPNRKDLQWGGPFIAYHVRVQYPYVVHAQGLMA